MPPAPLHAFRARPRPYPAAWLALLLALPLVLLGWAVPARALDWSTLAQPSGTFVGDTANPSGVYAPATINAVLGGTPPFDSGTSVTLIRLTGSQQFVRFYNPTDLTNPSNAVGSWMMRASEVRGLTAAQIRDKFALPALPTNMVQVLVPTGYALYTGIAAPIAGWGDGGGLQNRLMANKPPSGDIAADPWLAAGNYVNAQALSGAAVLSYRAPSSESRSASSVGAYMDGLAPRAGSDLEGVYNALDTLVFTGGQASVGQAMEQFSPARFDALNAVSLRTGALLGGSLDARSSALAQGDGTGAESVLLASAGGLEGLRGLLPRRAGDWSLWTRATGEYVRDHTSGAAPYASGTAALHAGADRPLGRGWTAGLALGLARTLLDWEQDGGDAVATTASLTGYAFWAEGEWFADSELGLDAGYTEARRRIRTAVADRVARSAQTGEGASLRVRAGRRLALDRGWSLVPALELGYALHRQNPFRESGAGELGLDVRAATAQTLVTGAELGAVRRADLDLGASLQAEARIGWRREMPLDSRVQRAAFSGYSQGFQAYGDDEPRDSLTLGAGMAHRDADGLTRFARYSGTLRQGVQAHSLELGLCWAF